jgi:hypothetical protein
MFEVINKQGLGLGFCPTLDEAMKFAKTTDMFVTIKGPEFEVCGIFGVDTVRDGICPDGVKYSWIKRRSL